MALRALDAPIEVALTSGIAPPAWLGSVASTALITVPLITGSVQSVSFQVPLASIDPKHRESYREIYEYFGRMTTLDVVPVGLPG